MYYFLRDAANDQYLNTLHCTLLIEIGNPPFATGPRRESRARHVYGVARALHDRRRAQFRPARALKTRAGRSRRLRATCCAHTHCRCYCCCDPRTLNDIA